MRSVPATHSPAPFPRDFPADRPAHPAAVGPDRRASPSSLLARARAGDRAAFEAIVCQYQDAVYGYVCRLLGGMGGADDAGGVGREKDALHLTQDVFLRAHLALPHASDDEDVWVWLCHIATGVCLAAQRWRWRVRRRPSADDVQSILAAMRPKHRACLALREYCGFSYDEIAQVLSVSRTAVRSLVFRARQEFVGALTYRPAHAGRRAA